MQLTLQYELCFQVMKEKIEEYRNAETTVVLQEDPFAICVVTPIRKRAHHLPLAKSIIFMDSTASCDSQNHSITFLLTPCAAGAAPLCVLITQGQTELEYAAALLLLKDAMGTELFGGIGDPGIFIIDDSDAKRNAILKIWPTSKCKTCQFHVAQAIWRWLWDSKHKILMDDRKPLMREFQQVMKAETIINAELQYNNVKTSETGMKYPNWLFYIDTQWNVRDRWCCAWRGIEMCGHHTNNFSETAVRIYKDNVLGRFKAYNSAALVDYTATVMEMYYKHRFQKFAHCRDASARLFMKMQLTRSQYLQNSEKIQQISETQFMVPSEHDDSKFYEIVTEVGLCTCRDGRYGKFCKHEASIYKFFDSALPNLPKTSAQDRRDIAFLALGDKVEAAAFYEDLRTVIDGSEPVVNHQEKTSTHLVRLDPHDATLAALNEDKEHTGSDNTNENAENVDPDLHELHNVIEKAHFKFGSSRSGIQKLIRRIQGIKSVGQWESFCHAGQFTRFKEGSAIHTQPTSKARRKPGITRGSKRLPAGRPAATDVIKKHKRPRCLEANISKNIPNAKSH